MLFLITLLCGVWLTTAGSAFAQEEQTIDEKIDSWLGGPADFMEMVVFWKVPIAGGIPMVLILLVGTALFLTVYFRFINLWAFGVAFRTVRGRYTNPDAPGIITHFQALSAALSATVGLGNIAGVAIAIGIGGPGATLWMILMGICGMTTKFCECTLGVKYRVIDEKGAIYGGAMYYLSKGLKEKGMGGIGKVLALIFAVMCIGGAFGAGNMFQVNQAHEQFSETFGILEERGWLFGLILSVIVGMVIIGGIKSIARVASLIVPVMCIVYVVAAAVIVLWNVGKVPEALGIIVTSAFAPISVAGGIVGVLIQGVKRAAFSNEAGLGSAPIAHSPVKTDRAASEGLVALLEPFVDTVIVCTMTALVIVTTGMWKVGADVEEGGAALMASPENSSTLVSKLDDGTMLRVLEEKKGKNGAVWHKVALVNQEEINIDTTTQTGWVKDGEITQRTGTGGGIWLTSQSFETVIGWFPIILTLAVTLFAFSTMISWSYYGEQAVMYIFGHKRKVILIYQLVFCICIVVGASASLGNVMRLSDAMVFAMVTPNLIGVYLLLPVVKRELASYLDFTRKKDRGETVED